MNFSEENLIKEWALYSGELSFEMRKCQSCSSYKPVIVYHGVDNTCNLCRKMLRLNIKYSHKIKFSKETMLTHEEGSTVCQTCGLETRLEDMADFSYECAACWLCRCYVEVAKYTRIAFVVKCLRCQKLKSVVDYPNGRLTCKSCICDINANGNGDNND